MTTCAADNSVGPARAPVSNLYAAAMTGRAATVAQQLRERIALGDVGAGGALESEAALAVGSTGPEFARFIEQEQKRWQPVIARARIKPD